MRTALVVQDSPQMAVPGSVTTPSEKTAVQLHSVSAFNTSPAFRGVPTCLPRMLGV